MTKLEDIFLLWPACLFSLNNLIFIYVRQAANSRLMRYVWDTSSRVPKQRDLCNFEWNKWKLMPSKLETSQTSWSVVMIYSCPRLSIQHLCVWVSDLSWIWKQWQEQPYCFREQMQIMRSCTIKCFNEQISSSPSSFNSHNSHYLFKKVTDRTQLRMNAASTSVLNSIWN